MNTDLFDLSILESEDEFASNSPADPEKHFNPDNSGEKAVSVPADVTLDADAYNQALDALKKSFKEGAEVLEMLQHASIVNSYNESVFDEQDKYSAELVTEALFNSYCDGPIYETVDRRDKDDVKRVTSEVRGSVERMLEDNDVQFCKARRIFPLLMAWLHYGTVTGNLDQIVNGTQVIVPNDMSPLGISVERQPMDAASKAFKIADTIRAAYFAGTRLIGGIKQLFVARSYQTVCLAFFQKNEVDSMMKKLNDECAGKLDDYKLVAIPINKNIASLFQRIKSYSKGNFNFYTYLILVDKEKPGDIDKEQNTVTSALKEVAKEIKKKNGDKDKSKSKGDGVKKESALNDTDDEYTDIFDESVE